MDIVSLLSDKATDSGCRVWVSNKYTHTNINSLKDEKMLGAFEDALEEANFLDCIWFKGDKNMPAIFKVCENGDFIEALYRLKTMKEMIPPYFTSYFLIAEDDLETQISLELKKPVFKNFDVKIIPTSKLESFHFSVGQS